jgi:hypothetical protein
LLQTSKIPLSGVAERDQNKIGKFMVANWLKIYSEDYVRDKAHYMLVLPWHFKDQIVKREQSWLESGGVLIFPLPTPHLVTSNGEVDLLNEDEIIKFKSGEKHANISAASNSSSTGSE